VPIYGRAESLNLAAAAAVCLYASAQSLFSPGGTARRTPRSGAVALLARHRHIREAI